MVSNPHLLPDSCVVGKAAGPLHPASQQKLLTYFVYAAPFLRLTPCSRTKSKILKPFLEFEDQGFKDSS
jgi:hypothetical protein